MSRVDPRLSSDHLQILCHRVCDVFNLTWHENLLNDWTHCNNNWKRGKIYDFCDNFRVPYKQIHTGNLLKWKENSSKLRDAFLLTVIYFATTRITSTWFFSKKNFVCKRLFLTIRPTSCLATSLKNVKKSYLTETKNRLIKKSWRFPSWLFKKYDFRFSLSKK